MNNINYNIFDEERRNNFYELYISNVDKRLRELDQPKEVDCKRWVWELIQNAKDSIVGQTDKKNVDIEIIAEGDKYTFRHNGSPFIKKTLYGLLYKYSKGKKDNSETTGRFGTGFLTTHTLSKIVNISGDIVLDDQLKGFSVTMYREGEGEELLEGLNKTENSFQLFDTSFGWTTYEYFAKTERNKEAGRLGIQNFKENITKVMLFCPEINSVKLNDNGKLLSIKQGDKFNNLQNGCEKLTLNLSDDNHNFSRTFLYENYEEMNKEMSERFKQNRYLKICCAIEIDNDNNIFVDESSPCLFCSLPFVGSEKHKLPFIINSQNFEPDSERQSILLDGDEINEKTGKISDQGINKMILIKSQKMYENLLQCLCNEDIGKRYYLARGLTYIPENDEIQSFDHQWYKDKFVSPMRDSLMKYSIVWNGESYIKLENLPTLKHYNDSSIYQQAYRFIASVYPKQVPTYEESIQFENYIWKGDTRIKYITMNECTQELSKYGNMSTLSGELGVSWEWMDDFLMFIKKYELKCLKSYKIIPNMKGDFVDLSDILSTSKDVPDNMIDCLERIGQPWKSTHIHKRIKKFTSGTDHNIQYAMAEIRNSIRQSFDKILILISYIPEDNEDKNFIQKRHSIYELCLRVFNHNSNCQVMPDKLDGSLFPKELWNGIDEMIFDTLLQKIQKCGSFSELFTIEYMKKFLECVSEYYPTFINYSVVPNQNGKFCRANSLYEDNQIPEVFKECVKNHFNYDIREELIDNQLTYIKALLNGHHKNIYDYISLLDGIFNSKEMPEANKYNASRDLIRIIPRVETEVENQANDWQKFQRDIFNIYELFSNRKDEYFEIQCDYQGDERLWHYANVYIYKEIVSIIERYHSISELSQAFNLPTAQQVFDYLNTIIKISSEGRIIPNQYEEFCRWKDLYNEGIPNVETKTIEFIPEELKDISKGFGYDVRKYLLHPRMDRICNKNVSEKEMNEKIAKLMEDNNNNPSKRSDSNFYDVANSLIEYNFEKIRNNSLNDEIMYIFGKVYLANIRNRLRELEHPSSVDCKRWIWELIQNAKDSIIGQKDRKEEIAIEIIVEGDKYIFKHNGSPFTGKTLSALLYKFSESKSDSAESIGRFGTGFLTTHSLSKVVNISGNILSGERTNRFTVTIYREGEEKELLEGLNKTKNSYHEFPNPDPSSEEWTIYEYIAKTEKNKEAGRLGIQNFKENITKVMLFCPEIRSVKLVDNGKILTVQQGMTLQNLTGGCEKLTLDINDDNTIFSRTFIYIKREERSRELSERFEEDRNLRISCALEIDNDNNIFIDESSPSLFCSLPLVGSEKLKLPFIINSQDFEPDSERQFLLLEGKEVNERTGKISNQGINKMILLNSRNMFEHLLECLCSENVGKRYLLTRGLTSVPGNDDIHCFDQEWYTNLFISPMRDILLSTPIVYNGEEYIHLKNLPMINQYHESDIQHEAYHFITRIYDKQVPTLEESIQFERNIWKNDRRIKYITMEECVKDISDFKNMEALSTKFDTIEEAWEWIDDFLVFIKKNQSQFLGTYGIIPNMHSDFVRLTDHLLTSKEVPDNMIECLEKIGQPWKTTHIHKNIKKFTSGMDHNIPYAISIIKSCFNQWSDTILTVISYIPSEDEDKKYVEKRQTLYELCKIVFEDAMPDKMDGNLFPKVLWNGIDEMVFEKLIEAITNQGKLEGIYTIEFMKMFLECASEYYPTFRNYPIVPNQNGIFCLVDDLFEDNQIPELFKDGMKNYFNTDIRKELIDRQLTYIKALLNGRSKKISDYITTLNNNYTSKSITEDSKRNFSREMIRIIPKKKKKKEEDEEEKKKEEEEEEEEEEEGNEEDEFQRNIYDIYKIFTKFESDPYEIQSDYQNKGLWYHPNKYIYDEIVSVIEKYNTMSEVSEALGIPSSSKILDYLNALNKISLEGKIFPNQYEQFCYLKYLYNEGIPNLETNEIELISVKLKDIAKDLGYDVRKYLIHTSMNRICANNVSEKEMNEKIAKLLEDNNNDPTKRKDSSFNDVANSLIEYNFLKLRDNSLNDEIMYIFGKVYIANIRNRLRELENPSVIDSKRWVWELIQNAKDSIVGQKDKKKSIDIEIIVEGNNYTFKHNGSPFTNKTLPALLYKFSEGKANSIESIGRFGTGFLTTHSVAKTIKISGDILSKNELKRFSVTMFREGEEEELLEGLNKTKNSYHEVPTETEGWTIFEYEAVTEKNKEAGRLGIQNFKENITKVMLFCPEIHSVKLNDNGKMLTITQNGKKDHLEGGCSKLILDVEEDQKTFARTFLYLKREESSRELTERFKADRHLRISCAVEIDNEDNIFVNELSPCLFCSLPVVGSEKHKLPCIINSPDFELNTERQAILLDGKEINEKTGKISDQGINKMILRKSQTMYETLLACLCKDKIGKRYLLARGLTTLPDNETISSFDSDWYRDNFVVPMRNILMKYAIVWNGEKYIELKNLPTITYYSNLDIRKEAYDFIAKAYEKQIPTFEESIQFEKYIWKKDDKIKYITMEQCVTDISNYQNMKALSANFDGKIEEAFKWIDDFLVFIKRNEPRHLKSYSIIPNMRSEFVRLTDTLSSSKEVPDNMIECLEKIGQAWKVNHIHKSIKKYVGGVDHNIQYAISIIKGHFSQWSDKILIVISYIPNDHGDKKYLEKRNIIYDLCKTIYGNSMPDKMDGSTFPEILWNGLDEIVFSKIINNIMAQKRLGGIYTIEFIKKFLECVSEYYPTFINYAIVPNQNGEFCLASKLYEDYNIPDLFKECMWNSFHQDIKSHLLDKRLNSIKALTFSGKKSILDYIKIIEKGYHPPPPPPSPPLKNNRRIPVKPVINNTIVVDKVKLSRYLIRIIPKDLKGCSNDQRKIFELYQLFTKTNSNCCDIEADNNNSKLWKDANTFIFKEIKNIIETHKDTDSLANYLGVDREEKIFEYLNFIIKKGSPEGKIIPNQYKIFCSIGNLCLESLNEAEKISDELKDIAKDFGFDVRAKLIHSRIHITGITGIETLTQIKLSKKIDEIMKDKYKNPSLNTDPSFKHIVSNLVENYFEKIGIDKFKELFVNTFKERENIILNIIYNKETRKNMAELGKKYGEHCIPKLLENEDIVNLIMEGKLDDSSNVKLFIERFDEYEEIIGLILENPDILGKIGGGNKQYKVKEAKPKPKPSKYSELEKKYGKDSIEKLLKNEAIIKLIIDDKLQDKGHLKSMVDKYNDYDDIIEKLLKNPEVTNMIEKGEITDSSYKTKNEIVTKLSEYSKVDEKYGKQCVPKLIENEGIVHLIMGGKLQDIGNVKSLIDKYNGYDNIIGKLLSNPEITKNIEKGEITDSSYKTKNEIVTKLSEYSKVDEKYGKQCVPKLIENEGIVHLIMGGKLQDKGNVKSLIDKYNGYDNIIGKLLSNPEITKNIEKGEITDSSYKEKNETVSKLSEYSKVDEKYGKQCVPKLIENEGIVNLIVEGKLQDKGNVKSLIDKYDGYDDIIGKLLSNPEVTNSIEKGEITDENYQHNREVISKYSEIDEKYGDKEVSKLVENEGIVNLIMEDKLQENSHLKSMIDKYDDYDDILDKLLKNPEVTSMIEKGEITDENYKNTNELISKYGDKYASKLMENEGFVTMIMEGKLQDKSNLKVFIDNCEGYDFLIEKLIKNPIVIYNIVNGIISDENCKYMNELMSKYSGIDKKFGDKCVSKLLENEGIVNMIVKGKLDNKKIKSLLEQYSEDDEIINKLLEYPKKNKKRKIIL